MTDTTGGRLFRAAAAALLAAQLAAPASAAEGGKPLYVRTAERIPAAALEGIRGREYKLLVDPARTKKDARGAFEEIWALVRAAAARRGFELPEKGGEKFALDASTREYFDTPDQKLWQAGYLVRVSRGAKEEKAGTAVLTVKAIREDPIATLGARLAVTGGKKAWTEAEENVGIWPGGLLGSYVEKGSGVTVPAEALAVSTLGAFARFVPELLTAGLAAETPLVGKKVHALRARPGSVVLPGVKPCVLSLEAWSNEAGGPPSLLDVSFGYGDVDYASSAAAHAAGERFTLEVLRDGLAPLTSEADSRWGGSKVRKLMGRPLTGPAAALGETGPVTTVVLLRHAEKASKSAQAKLTRAGERRAEALVAELAPLAPAALYASDLPRTRQTLAPLAARTGLEVEVRPIGEEGAVAAEILADHRGSTVVVCGHSDTLMLLAAGLGWKGDFPVVQDFSRLFTLTIPPGEGSPLLAVTRQKFVAR